MHAKCACSTVSNRSRYLLSPPHVLSTVRFTLCEHLFFLFYQSCLLSSLFQIFQLVSLKYILSHCSILYFYKISFALQFIFINIKLDYLSNFVFTLIHIVSIFNRYSQPHNPIIRLFVKLLYISIFLLLSLKYFYIVSSFYLLQNFFNFQQIYHYRYKCAFNTYHKEIIGIIQYFLLTLYCIAFIACVK